MWQVKGPGGEPAGTQGVALDGKQWQGQVVYVSFQYYQDFFPHATNFYFCGFSQDLS